MFVKLDDSRRKNIRQFATKLGTTETDALGQVVSLWLSAVEMYEDGDLSRLTAEEVAGLAGYNGGSVKGYIDQLVDCKLLDRTPVGGLLIHGWIDIAGTCLMNMYAKRKRDKLVAIWAKHGMTYGMTRKDVTPDPAPAVEREPIVTPEDGMVTHLVNVARTVMKCPNGSDTSRRWIRAMLAAGVGAQAIDAAIQSPEFQGQQMYSVHQALTAKGREKARKRENEPKPKQLTPYGIS